MIQISLTTNPYSYLPSLNMNIYFLYLFSFFQVRPTDSSVYFSCDDHFLVVDKAVDYGRAKTEPARELRSYDRNLRPSLAVHAVSSQGHFKKNHHKFIDLFIFYQEWNYLWIAVISPWKQYFLSKTCPVWIMPWNSENESPFLSESQ